MLAAAHLDNLIVLIFFGIAILFQLLTRTASRGRRRPPDRRRSISPSQMPRPTSQEDQESDEERIRKFLEALGQPTTSKPPPPVAPRPTYQRPVVVSHVPPFGSPLPPLKARPPELPHEIRLPGQIPPTREAKTFRPRVVDAPAFEVHDIRAPLTAPPVITTAAEAYAIASRATPKRAEKENDIVTMLRSTSALRDAIILREIFGPPRSLQPLDLVRTV